MSERIDGQGSASQPEQNPRKRRSAKKRVAGVAGFILVATAGLGYAIESHTNEVAEGKIKTAEACRSIDPDAREITEKIDECMERGIPGGRSVGDGKLHVEDPIVFLTSYIEAQKHEAEQVEMGRVALWSVGVPTAVAIYVSAS